jgi:transcriptional regulator with XRE-family HTH domain
MTYSAERWHELGEQLIRRRVALGFPKRSEFAKHLRLTHDRTLSDIENGRRANYSAATLGQLEGHYRLAVRAITDFLEGAPTLVGDPGGMGGTIAEAASAHGHDLEGMLAVVDVAGTTAHRRAERDDEGGAWDALYALYTLLAGEFTGAQAPITTKGSDDGTAIGADSVSATQPPPQPGDATAGGSPGNIRTLRSDDEVLS